MCETQRDRVDRFSTALLTFCDCAQADASIFITLKPGSSRAEDLRGSDVRTRPFKLSVMQWGAALLEQGSNVAGKKAQGKLRRKKWSESALEPPTVVCVS